MADGGEQKQQLRVGDVLLVLPNKGFLGLVDYEPVEVMSVTDRGTTVVRPLLQYTHYSDSGYFFVGPWEHQLMKVDVDRA
jgi:hypothetical protein